MIGVTENLALISDLLHQAAIEAGRRPSDVRLLDVSKKQPLEKIREAAAAGQRDFGENFVQEGVEKIEALSDLDLTWHFIGHLQSNKTRVVAEYFDWVHTIDKLKTAHRLNDQRPPGRPPLNICIQVNVDDEASKSGVSPAAKARYYRDSLEPSLDGLGCRLSAGKWLIFCNYVPNTSPLERDRAK